MRSDVTVFIVDEVNYTIRKIVFLRNCFFDVSSQPLCVAECDLSALASEHLHNAESSLREALRLCKSGLI